MTHLFSAILKRSMVTPFTTIGLWPPLDPGSPCLLHAWTHQLQFLTSPSWDLWHFRRAFAKWKCRCCWWIWLWWECCWCWGGGWGMGLAQPSEGMDDMGDVGLVLVQLTCCFFNKGWWESLQSKNMMLFFGKKKVYRVQNFHFHGWIRWIW